MVFQARKNPRVSGTILRGTLKRELVTCLFGETENYPELLLSTTIGRE